MMGGGIQIGRVSFEIVTHMEMIECAGYKGHSRMSGDGFTGESKFSVSLIDDFTRTAFPDIVSSHPFDDPLSRG